MMMMMMIGDDDKDSGVTHAKSNQNIENSLPLTPFTLDIVPTLDRCQTEVRGRHLRQSNIGFSQERRRK